MPKETAMRRIGPFVCFLFLFLAMPGMAESDEKPSTIEIAARATVTSEPNMLTLSFAVDTDGPLAKDAVSENGERTEKVLGALRKVGGKESKIWTSGFTLSPLYEKGDPTKPSGFRARNTVILESKLLDKAGAFVDEAAEAGVSRITNLAFTSDKEEDLRRQAAVEALKQATRDAEMLAKAAGLAIKRVVTISHDQREHGPPGVLREAAFAGAQTPIAIGEITVHASVHVVFELE
jgi:uncharacterized protein